VTRRPTAHYVAGLVFALMSLVFGARAESLLMAHDYKSLGSQLIVLVPVVTALVSLFVGRARWGYYLSSFVILVYPVSAVFVIGQALARGATLSAADVLGLFLAVLFVCLFWSFAIGANSRSYYRQQIVGDIRDRPGAQRDELDIRR
jgi:hypothetical protein